MFFGNIDALDPPEHTVAPIAPFIRDKELTYDCTIDLGYEVLPAFGRLEQCCNAGSDPVLVQMSVFRFARKSTVKFRNDWRVC